MNKPLNALIIEDEVPAQANLRRALEKENLRVIDVCSSVRGAVEWLRNADNRADIIFMDVELSDGMCFDIFSQVEVRGKVVITTAYDNYAIRAFRVNSIDYLLKPVVPEELHAAVERCRAAIGAEERPAFDVRALRAALVGDSPEYKRRFAVRLGDKIAVVGIEEVAYFYAEDKYTYLVTTEGRQHIVDISLDALAEQLDPRMFFRISRACTVSVGAIKGVTKHLSNRFKLTLAPQPEFDVFVSRQRTADFLAWLEG